MKIGDGGVAGGSNILPSGPGISVATLATRTVLPVVVTMLRPDVATTGRCSYPTIQASYESVLMGECSMNAKDLFWLIITSST